MLGLVVDGRKRLKVRDEDGGGLIPGLSARNPRSSRTESQLQTEHDKPQDAHLHFFSLPFLLSISPSHYTLVIPLHRPSRVSFRPATIRGRRRPPASSLRSLRPPLTPSLFLFVTWPTAPKRAEPFSPLPLARSGGLASAWTLVNAWKPPVKIARLNGRHEKKGPSKILEPKGEPEGAKCKKGGRSNDGLKGEGGRVEKTFVLQSEGGRQSGWE